MRADELIDKFLNKHRYRRAEPRAALVDMDGTLYDSMGNHANAWYRLFSEMGVEVTREEFFLYEGRTGASTINLIFNRAFHRDATREEAAELYRRKSVYFSEQPPVRPIAGARELLETFRRAGMKRVLVTGSGQASLLERVPVDFPGAFERGMSVTSADVTTGKPHPEPFTIAMRKAGVAPWQSIAVENAPLGVRSASDAGAFTVAVTTGPIPAAELEKAGADVVCSSMGECLECMPALIGQLSIVKQVTE